MKIETLKLLNFRQFYGSTEIEFASGVGERNITVFHGYNGSGKTALLNAFVWCLYGTVTPDLENQDKLENEKAIAEAGIGAEIRVSVSLRFGVHDEVWSVERSRVSVKTGAGTLQRRGSDMLSLQRIRSNGEIEDVTEALRQTRIHQVLPDSLYPFFFFNGERVERLAGSDAYDQVEAGIKTLLDIAVYERGADHLRRLVAGEFQTELKSFGNEELRLAIEEQQAQQKAEQEALGGIAAAVENARALNVEVAEIERKQSEIRELHEFTRQREDLRGREGGLKDQIRGVSREIAAEISRDGYLAFAERTLDVTDDLIAGARKKGDIPAKIKPQFVDDLLAKRVCICGEPIVAGSSHEEHLQQWRRSTGLAELEEQINYVGAGVRPMRERRRQLYTRLDALVARRAGLESERSSVRQQLDLLDEQIGDRSLGEDAARLQDSLRQRQRDLQYQLAQKIVCESSLNQIRQSLEEIQKRIEKLNVQNERGAVVKRQLEAVYHVADAFDRITEIQKEDVREALGELIAAIWKDAAIKDYRATVSEDYKLLLTKTVDGQQQQVHGASTGEKQVLALSFVGALVRKAGENVGRSLGSGVVAAGGHYPVVMDSPFGALEDDYRQKIAEWLPKLAHQVVVMVSKTQWRNEVETAMRDKIGREYILELHTSKERAERTIEIRGEAYPYVVSSSDGAEMTVIRRVL